VLGEMFTTIAMSWASGVFVMSSIHHIVTGERLALGMDLCAVVVLLVAAVLFARRILSRIPSDTA
jgi:hypothetical protein